jgi:hypothetical protein
VPRAPAAGLAKMFELLEAAQEYWRCVNGVNGAPRVALVKDAAKVERGLLVGQLGSDALAVARDQTGYDVPSS